MYVSTLSRNIHACGGEAVGSYMQAAALAETEERADLWGPAMKAFQCAGRDLGVALAAVVNLVNPEKLLISGPIQLTSVDAYASARAFDAGLAETFHAHGFGGLGDPTIVERAYQNSYDAALGAAAVLLRRTVYATPAEVPSTAMHAVPWLPDQRDRPSRTDKRQATMAAVGNA
jgi:predicted NBD/HSP70 family sugar kinase